MIFGKGKDEKICSFLIKNKVKPRFPWIFLISLMKTFFFIPTCSWVFKLSIDIKQNIFHQQNKKEPGGLRVYRIYDKKVIRKNPIFKSNTSNPPPKTKTLHSNQYRTSKPLYPSNSPNKNVKNYCPYKGSIPNDI
jgi:hypothetical protein